MSAEPSSSKSAKLLSLDAAQVQNFVEKIFQAAGWSAADAKGDHDHDGLGNLNEFKLHGKPNDADTDNDGSDDGDERRDHTLVDRTDSDRDGRRDEARQHQHGHEKSAQHGGQR